MSTTNPAIPVEIEVNQQGIGTVTLEGNDISRKVAGATIVIMAGQPPTVTLHMARNMRVKAKVQAPEIRHTWPNDQAMSLDGWMHYNEHGS